MYALDDYTIDIALRIGKVTVEDGGRDWNSFSEEKVFHVPVKYRSFNNLFNNQCTLQRERSENFQAIFWTDFREVKHIEQVVKLIISDLFKNNHQSGFLSQVCFFTGLSFLGFRYDFWYTSCENWKWLIELMRTDVF